MYANFTQETCTSNGDVITLTGATEGMHPFSASFVDGDEVAYTIKAGSILVRGIGLYNQNTITRRDMWNSNAGVITKSPSSNIPLGSGSHLIYCTEGAETVKTIPFRGLHSITFSRHAGVETGVSNVNILPDHVYYMPFLADRELDFNKVVFRIYNPSETAAGRAIVGFVRASQDGQPLSNITQTTEIDISQSGGVYQSLNGRIPAGWSYVMIMCNEAFGIGGSSRSTNGNSPLMNALETGGVFRGRILARLPAAYSSTFPNPLPPLTGKGVDLTDLPSIGIRNDA